MRRTLLPLIASVILIWAFVVHGSSRIPQPPERYPKLHQAIGALQAARVEIEPSNSDFGGYRKDTLQAIDNASRQVRLAIQFAKK